MRGYGDSDKPSAIREYTLDRLADDIEELVQILGLILILFPNCFHFNGRVLGHKSIL